jgi:hypothetical protein
MIPSIAQWSEFTRSIGDNYNCHDCPFTGSEASAGIIAAIPTASAAEAGDRLAATLDELVSHRLKPTQMKS